MRIFPASLHQTGKTQLTPLDLSEALSLPYPATAPNLLASFIEVKAGESLETGVEHATSQSFYVMRGKGSSVTRAGLVEWSRGDLFVLPYLGDDAPSVCHSSPMVVGRQCVRHVCESDDEFGSCSLYFVHDEPLLQYLGARPVDTRRFQPAMYVGQAPPAAITLPLLPPFTPPSTPPFSRTTPPPRRHHHHATTVPHHHLRYPGTVMLGLWLRSILLLLPSTS